MQQFSKYDINHLRETADIKSLDLSNKYIGPNDMKALYDILKYKRMLTEVNFSNNQLDETCVTHIGALLMSIPLVNLDLSNNKLKSLGAFTLCQLFIDYSPLSLTRLNLANNEVSDQAIKMIGKKLQAKNSLTHLDLRKNDIGAKGAKSLGLMLYMNRSLTNLELDEAKIETLEASVPWSIKNRATKINYRLVVWHVNSRNIIPDRLRINNQKKTAFHLAASQGDLDTVKMYDQQGVCLDARPEGTTTALHIAVQRNDKLMVEYLVEHGANIYLEALGQTANTLAESLKHGDITNFFNEKRLIYGNVELSPPIISYIADAKIIEVLILINCKVDDKLVERLIDIFSKYRNLTRLNLENNYISSFGFNLLLRDLPSTVKSLCLSANRVDYNQSPFLTPSVQLKDVDEALAKYNQLKIDLSANLLVSHKRNKEAKKIFCILIVRSNVNLYKLLSAKFDKYSVAEDNSSSVVLSFDDNQKIVVTFSDREHQDIISAAKALRLHDEKALFEYFLSIKQCLSRIDPNLLSQNLFGQSISSQHTLDISKRILDYHPDAPLKSYFLTHRFFAIHQIKTVNSLLMPHRIISENEWQVFLLSKSNSGILNEHAFLAYEGLKHHGQRLFMVAHLTVISDGIVDMLRKFSIGIENRTEINFFRKKNQHETVEYLKSNYTIVGYMAKRKQILALHDEICSEIGKVKIAYKAILSSSSDATNCLKWAMDKIEKHLGVQFSKEDRGHHIPSIAVGDAKVQENPDEDFQTAMRSGLGIL